MSKDIAEVQNLSLDFSLIAIPTQLQNKEREIWKEANHNKCV
jgi:hypothetical protein